MSNPDNSPENPLMVSESDNSTVRPSDVGTSSVPVLDSDTSSVHTSDFSLYLSPPSDGAIFLGDLLGLEAPVFKRLRYSGYVETPVPLQMEHPNFAFGCTLSHPRYLKLAMEALADPHHNSSGSGRIDVDGAGFTITVQNTLTGAVAHLCLTPDEFWCEKRMLGKKVDFHHLFQVLFNIDDDALVDIVRCKKTGKLKFLLPGAESHDGHTIELVENYAVIRAFPDICVCCEATVSSEDMQLFAQHLLQQHSPHRVSVEIAGNIATLKAEGENSWEANYALHQVNDSREVGPRDRYSASFQWTSADLLQRMSQLDSNTGFLVRFHTVTPKCIVLRFDLPGQGCLEFMKEVREPTPLSLSL